MKLFRKHLRAEQLGTILYEGLRKGMETDGELSMEAYVGGISAPDRQLDEQYAGEIIVGLMFGAVLAIERSATYRVAEQIIGSMKAEFFNHLKEQGASAIERAEWETILAERFLRYRTCLENYSGFEPPWKLGREFYWNVIGSEDHTAMSVKISTLYILAARNSAQNILNEYGPSLLIETEEA